MIPAQQVMPGVVRAVIRKAPLTPEKVAFAWRAAVGPAVAHATTVDLLHGVLYVRTRDAAWEREIQRSAALIRSRLHEWLGEDAVRSLDVKRA